MRGVNATSERYHQSAVSTAVDPTMCLVAMDTRGECTGVTHVKSGAVPTALTDRQLRDLFHPSYCQYAIK